MRGSQSVSIYRNIHLHFKPLKSTVFIYDMPKWSNLVGFGELPTSVENNNNSQSVRQLLQTLVESPEYGSHVIAKSHKYFLSMLLVTRK